MNHKKALTVTCTIADNSI